MLDAGQSVIWYGSLRTKHPRSQRLKPWKFYTLSILKYKELTKHEHENWLRIS